MRYLSSVVLLFVYFSLTGCSASTGSRYEQKSNEETTTKNETEQKPVTTEKLNEDFDLSPYKTKIEVSGKERITETPSNVWFEYDKKNEEEPSQNISGTQIGYRVLVFASDNIEDANKLKLSLINDSGNNEIYIDFEPPFYKVKIGDFYDQKAADELRFKLNQLGYTEAKVIKDTINKFE